MLFTKFRGVVLQFHLKPSNQNHQTSFNNRWVLNDSKMHHSSMSPAEMDIQPPALPEDDPSSAMWDWEDLLDFASDDRLLFSPVSPPPPMIATQPESYPSPDESGSGSDRVRKRDPRLLCSNFVQGMVPCSCPELDQKLEEAELPKKKRVRGGSGVARCQVPGCEVDISELKGYHKRHRVCLTCANASSVVLDGEDKRYCQQCGKYVSFSALRFDPMPRGLTDTIVTLFMRVDYQHEGCKICIDCCFYKLLNESIFRYLDNLRRNS